MTPRGYWATLQTIRQNLRAPVQFDPNPREQLWKGAARARLRADRRDRSVDTPPGALLHALATLPAPHLRCRGGAFRWMRAHRTQHVILPAAVDCAVAGWFRARSGVFTDRAPPSSSSPAARDCGKPDADVTFTRSAACATRPSDNSRADVSAAHCKRRTAERAAANRTRRRSNRRSRRWNARCARRHDLERCELRAPCIRDRDPAAASNLWEFCLALRDSQSPRRVPSYVRR